MKRQRIRDPLHDLIEFENTELERALWRVVQSRPFQRLRRVKQLGFSDLVYPGASHSRFAHSLGVFETARTLMEVVRKHLGNRQESREYRALAAALVHDLGHGPFSHSFEAVGERLHLKMADHETVSDLLIRNGEIAEILNEMGSGFANDVADIIKKEGKWSVHNAVVSSQFDADRLDYMQRDRLMAGSHHAAIDFEWLTANLEIDLVDSASDNVQLDKVPTFVIGPKAIHAAEGYVLGLFQLYPTIYFHKATRGAEKLFTELMVRIIELVRDGSVSKVGLPPSHPIVKFANDSNNLEIAIALDDTVVWGALDLLAEADDPLVEEFSKRLRDRQLYECIDIRIRVAHAIDPKATGGDDEKIDRCCTAIEARLSDLAEQEKSIPRLIVDAAERSPYKTSISSPGQNEQIYVKTDGGTPVDLKERSPVVGALQKFKLLRAYVERDNGRVRQAVTNLVEEEISKCR